MAQDYNLTRIRDPDDPRLRKFYEFLKKNYDHSLIDPLRVIQEELKETGRGGYETPHAIVVSEGANGEIVAGASGNLIPINYRGRNLGVNFISYLAPERVDADTTTDAVGKLEKILGGFAARRGVDVPLSFLEAERKKIKVYGTWGFKTLEGVDYVQPPLDWDKDGNPSKSENLTLMARLNGKAYDANIANEEPPALRKGLVKAIGDYLFKEWYVPYEKERSEEANEKIWSFNQSLNSRFSKSLDGRKLIELQ